MYISSIDLHFASGLGGLVRYGGGGPTSREAWMLVEMWTKSSRKVSSHKSCKQCKPKILTKLHGVHLDCTLEASKSESSQFPAWLFARECLSQASQRLCGYRARPGPCPLEALILKIDGKLMEKPWKSLDVHAFQWISLLALRQASIPAPAPATVWAISPWTRRCSRALGPGTAGG